MKKVLIALDYDAFAEKIAATGYAVAKAMNAEVLLLHVVREPAFYSTTEYSPIMGYTGFSGLELTEAAHGLKKEAYNFLERSREHLGDNNIKLLATEGDFADAIIEAAAQFNADLIVMGTHPRKGLDKLLMGNLTEKILNTSSVPLLAIPEIKQD